MQWYILLSKPIIFTINKKVEFIYISTSDLLRVACTYITSSTFLFLKKSIAKKLVQFFNTKKIGILEKNQVCEM